MRFFGRLKIARKNILLLIFVWVLAVSLSNIAEVLINQSEAYSVESKKFRMNKIAKFDNHAVARDIGHQVLKKSLPKESEASEKREPILKNSNASEKREPIWNISNSSQIQEPASKLRKSWRELSILCIVHTCPNNLETRTKYIRDTWAKLCNKTLYVSDSENSTFPTIKLSQRTGFREMWAKTRKEMDLLYSEYIDKYDWFFKGDDDTYVIMNNLRRFLFNKNASEPIFYGRLMSNGFSKEGYLQGGAGYAFGKGALKRLVEVGFQKGKRCRKETFRSHGDDVYLGLCLADSGVKLAKDCFDSTGRELFHASSFSQQIIYQNITKTWFYRAAFYKKAMQRCCSNESVSFHQIYGTDHLFMDYLWNYFQKPD